MRRILTTIAAISIALGAKLPANEPGPPDLTKETLIGTWEAVSPDNPFVLRLELAARGPSYLVWTWDGHPIMCRLVSMKVRGGHVTLNFRPMRGNDISFNDLTISGKGYGDATVGILRGSLHISRLGDQQDHDEAIAFRRDPWVRWLPEYSKRSEELMRRAHREIK
ncbi:MAG: hypothetical protein QOF80_838 [Verrucomicrobiota bacterium]|jgi:hypothetical protein